LKKIAQDREKLTKELENHLKRFDQIDSTLSSKLREIGSTLSRVMAERDDAKRALSNIQKDL